MIKKLTLTEVAIYEKSKDGVVLTYKDRNSGEQRRYKKIRIGVGDMTEKLWGAIWDSKSSMNAWQAGMTVEVDVEQDPQGFWHFKLPTKGSEMNDRVKKIEERLSELEKEVYSWKEKELDELEVLEPLEDEITPADLPF
jgi:uncharacterized membrane protein